MFWMPQELMTQQPFGVLVHLPVPMPLWGYCDTDNLIIDGKAFDGDLLYLDI